MAIGNKFKEKSHSQNSVERASKEITGMYYVTEW